MARLSIREVGEKLAEGGQLKERSLCIYGADLPPPSAVPVVEVDRCLAKAIFIEAVRKETPPLFISEETKEECCPGGQAYFGLSQRHPLLKHFISTGSPDFRRGAAENLKASPELAETFFQATGEIRPLGKNIIVSACQEVEQDPGVKAILLFGEAEQIRNFCGLIQFRSSDLFTSILIPGGASCASFFTYASGMASKAPQNSAFVGPVDPTGNSWFPPNYLSLSVPIDLARQMAEDVDSSFLNRRRKIAFPEKRIKIS